jgi:hypothetical protein
MVAKPGGEPAEPGSSSMLWTSPGPTRPTPLLGGAQPGNLHRLGVWVRRKGAARDRARRRSAAGRSELSRRQHHRRMWTEATIATVLDRRTCNRLRVIAEVATPASWPDGAAGGLGLAPARKPHDRIDEPTVRSDLSVLAVLSPLETVSVGSRDHRPEAEAIVATRWSLRSLWFGASAVGVRHR